MSADQALVLAGHGSHHDARTAIPVHAHAERVRDRGCFDAVRAAFWKEQPSLAEVLDTVEAATTYVVPLMTSEGYFVDEVFPRELGLVDGDRADLGRTVRYTDPVGTHEGVVDVVIDRVDAVTAGAVDAAELGLALVGHGTERHAESDAATVLQATRLRALDRFAAVEPRFLDQAPNVTDLPGCFDVRDVVVVPLFIADGLHVTRDIPQAVGLSTGGAAAAGPSAVDGHRVWYTGAVGTAPSLTAVVLERAAEAGADIGRTPDRPVSTTERAFLRWLDRGDRAGGRHRDGRDERTRSWGELVVSVTTTADGGRRYGVRHRADRDVPTAALDRLDSPSAVRTRTGTDGAGNHRPLRTARGLPRGWVVDGLEPGAAVRAIRAVYPASIDHWHGERTGTLAATDFDGVVARQAGRYRDLDTLDPETRDRTVEACCGDCVRRRAWSAGADEPEPTDGAFPCPEPCSFLLEAARSFGDAEGAGARDDVDPSVPAAAFDRPDNRYRVRFHRAGRDPAVLPTEGGG